MEAREGEGEGRGRLGGGVFSKYLSGYKKSSARGRSVDKGVSTCPVGSGLSADATGGEGDRTVRWMEGIGGEGLFLEEEDFLEVSITTSISEDLGS